MIIDGENILDILNNVKALGSELSSLRNSTKQLIKLDQSEEENHKSYTPNSLTDGQRREKSHSAWAKSSTIRDQVLGPQCGTKRAIVNYDDDLNVNKATKAIKKSIPAYLFGSSRKALSETGDLDTEVPPPTRYNVKIDTLSTMSRSKGAIINRPTSHQLTSSSKVDTRREVEAEEGMELIEFEETVPMGGRSFGKAPRFHNSNSGDKLYDGHIDLNLEKCEEAVRPHTPSVVMRPPTAPAAAQQQARPTTPSASTAQQTPAGENLNLEALSYRHRPSAVRMTCNKTVRRNKEEADELPGPGHYDVSSSALKATKKGYGVLTGTIMHLHRKDATMRDLEAEMEEEKLGPGYYHHTDSRSLSTHKRIPNTVSMKAESKPGVHIERKKYFENKQREMREVNDFCLPVSYAVCDKRISSVTFTRPQSSSSSLSDKKIGEKHERGQLIREIDDLLAEEKVSVGMEEREGRNYTLVEPRAVAIVNMDREIKARERTQNLLSKEGIAVARAEKRKERERFYGPQLPVRWVRDKESMRRNNAVGGRYSTNSGSRSRSRGRYKDEEDSPTEEIMDLLGWGGGDELLKREEDDALASAYLQSRHSGSLYKKDSRVVENNMQKKQSWIDQEVAMEERNVNDVYLTNEEVFRARGNRGTSAVDLSKGRGREAMKVLRKGESVVREFGENADWRELEEIEGASSFRGPGQYDTMVGRSISTSRARGVVNFDKQKGREREETANVESDCGEKEGNVLDIDYGSAKDKASRYGQKKSAGMKLYSQDRYEGDLDGIDFENGERGMVAEYEGNYEADFNKIMKGKKAAGLVRFDKMTGREDLDKDRGIDNEQEGEVLDLEIKTTRPHKADKEGRVLAFGDPIKNPRFPFNVEWDEGEGEWGLDIDRGEAVDRGRGKTSRRGVDMGKMSGREDGQWGLEGVDEEIDGEVNGEQAKTVQGERDKGKETGREMGKSRRNTVAIEFDKMRGRESVRDMEEEERVVRGENAQTIYYKNTESDNFYGKERIKGLDMGKMGGREGDARYIEGEEEGGEQERQELDLDVTTKFSSKERRTIEARDWKKVRTKGQELFTVNEQGEVRSLSVGKETEGNILDLDDVDPGKFKKKSMQGFSAGRNGNGRNATMKDGYTVRDSSAVMRDILGEEEEVILSSLELAKDNQGRKGNSRIMSMRKKGDDSKYNSANAKKYTTIEEEDLNAELVLNPNNTDYTNVNSTINTFPKKVTITNANINSTLRLSVGERKALQELTTNDQNTNSNANGVLILETKENASKQKSLGYNSMNNKADDNISIVINKKATTAVAGKNTGNLLEDDLIVDNKKSKETLQLSPSDKALQKRTISTSSLQSSTTRLGQNLKVGTQDGVSLVGEKGGSLLNLSPKDQNVRTSHPNTSSLRNSETRFNTYQEDKAANELIRKNELPGNNEADLYIDTNRKIKNSNNMTNKNFSNKITRSTKPIPNNKREPNSNGSNTISPLDSPYQPPQLSIPESAAIPPTNKSVSLPNSKPTKSSSTTNSTSNLGKQFGNMKL